MRKKYATPQTSLTRVELEQGFMGASIYEKDTNTEDLTINDHEVDETWDFSSEDTWK